MIQKTHQWIGIAERRTVRDGMRRSSAVPGCRSAFTPYPARVWTARDRSKVEREHLQEAWARGQIVATRNACVIEIELALSIG